MRSRIRCAVARKFVADTPDRNDNFGLRRVSLDLCAQTVDVRVDSMLIAFMAVAPHFVEQISSAKNVAGVTGEVFE